MRSERGGVGGRVDWGTARGREGLEDNLILGLGVRGKFARFSPFSYFSVSCLIRLRFNLQSELMISLDLDEN